MNRAQALDRHYRRILYAGLGLSAAAHIGFLALRFTTVPLPTDAATISFQPAEAAAEPPEDRTELIQFVAAPLAASAATAFDLPSGPAAAAASLAAAPVATTGAGAPAASAVVAEVAFEWMSVRDPLTLGEISPIVFTDLPSAEPGDELEDGEADVPVYVPGSIGRAKRNWAGSNGTTPEGPGRGAFVIVGGAGGHCPMPGRVPPVWK